MANDPAPAVNETKPAPLDAPLPGARLALALLLSINLFNYIDRQVLAAVLPAIEAEFFPKSTVTNAAYVEEMLGLLATAFMVSYMVAAPLFGWLADRTSRWLLIGIGVLVWSLASGGSGLAPTFTLLLLTRCFVGVGEAAYGPAAPTVISDLYPVKRRSSMLGWFYMAIPVGGALGYALGGEVLKRTGNWRWAFYLVVLPGILLGILSFFMREAPRGQADATGPTGARKARLKEYLIFLKTPSYVLVSAGMTAMTFAAGGMAHWMPRYIHSNRGQPDLAQVNLIFGGIVVVSGLGATVLGGLMGDWLRARIRGAYFVVSSVSMLLAFPCVLLVLWTPFPLAWVFIFLSVFCLYFNTGPTNTILANVTHPSIRASGYAVNIFFIHALGDAISPVIIGSIGRQYNWEAAFAFVSATVLLGGIAWLWGARYLEKDTALAPTRLKAE